MKRLLSAGLSCLLVLAAALAAAGPDPAEPGLSDEEITIGSWGPLTGPAAPWGAVVRGMETYFAMINQDGGINGRQVKLVRLDNESDPEKTPVLVKNLVEEQPGGVFALVGGVGTAANLTVLDYVAEQGLPWVGPAGGSPVFTSPPRKNIFAVCPDSAREAALLVRYAVEVLRKTSIAVIYQDGPFGQRGLTGARQQASRHGLKLQAITAVKYPKDDMMYQAELLLKSLPEVVLVWLSPLQAVGLRQAAARIDFHPLWMTGSFLSDTTTMDKITGRNWEGTIFTTFTELPRSRSPLLRRYKRAFDRLAAKGERWGSFFYGGFGLAEPLVEGLRRSGPYPTREKFFRQMETIKEFQGIMAPLTYGPGLRTGVDRVFLGQALKNGLAKQLTGWVPLAGE